MACNRRFAGLLVAIVGLVTLDAYAVDFMTCHDAFYQAITNPDANIAAALAQREQCLGHKRVETIQQREQAARAALAAAYAQYQSPPWGADPVLALLLGFDPAAAVAWRAAAERQLADALAVAAYYEQERQRVAAQAQEDAFFQKLLTELFQ